MAFLIERKDPEAFGFVEVGHAPTLDAALDVVAENDPTPDQEWHTNRRVMGGCQVHVRVRTDGQWRITALPESRSAEAAHLDDAPNPSVTDEQEH